jgi:cytochrome c biogenesis protein CcmG/thiol:disulfide interchange protein DsbE
MTPALPKQRLLGGGLRLAALLLVLVLSGLLAYRIAHGVSGTRLARAINAHRAPPAPNLRLPVIWSNTATWPPRLRRSVDRGTLQLRDLRGYPVVVNFWASWCSPCEREAVLLASTAEAHRGNVVFVGVDINDVTGDARHFLRAREMPYVAVHSGSSTADRFGLIGLPETFYVDRAGRIQGVTRGELSATTLDRALARLSRG